MPEAAFSELDALIRSRHPVLVVPSAEEGRLEELLGAVAASHRPPRQIWRWDFASGFAHDGKAAQAPDQAILAVLAAPADAPLIVVLRDLHRFWDNPLVARLLRNAAAQLRTTRKTLVLVAPGVVLPKDLAEDLTLVALPLPDEEALGKALHDAVPEKDRALSPRTEEALLRAARGLSLQAFRRALARAMVAQGCIDERTIQAVLSAKRRAVAASGVLEVVKEGEGLEGVGGLALLKAWLARRGGAFGDKARRYGLPAPKGVLLVGLQGTGKSLVAQAVARAWSLPLLRLDVGRLMGSLVGESEARARQALELAESMAPCVLWIDELDKAFAGANGAGDSGVSARVLGFLLTWMQEKEAPAFVVATANRVDLLPPELLRKGRFDELFYLGLPTEAERTAIFEVHLKRFRPLSWQSFDLARLAMVSGGFSGAEIEQAIVEAMHEAFEAEREVNTDDVISAVRQSVPLSRTAGEHLAALEAWAAGGRARAASSEPPPRLGRRPDLED